MATTNFKLWYILFSINQKKKILFHNFFFFKNNSVLGDGGVGKTALTIQFCSCNYYFSSTKKKFIMWEYKKFI